MHLTLLFVFVFLALECRGEIGRQLLGQRKRFRKNLPDPSGPKCKPSASRVNPSVPAELESRSFNPLPPIKVRAELKGILQKEGKEVGAELGVQLGLYSRTLLEGWPSCKKYVLVDVWANQSNYLDGANVDQKSQDSRYHRTLRHLAPWSAKLEVCRNFTHICADNYPNSYFDFVYIDARHDYKGALEDMEKWWPKLKSGGIFAGHDYCTNNDGPRQAGDDWSINYDGTKDICERAVKGAVDDFSLYVGRQLSISYREKSWNTWVIRK
mmetsp:Transcript_37651/g.118659  ORF Transcript_37651/g.118659 Transcript_37651/m.118659 type:complete len:268 (-) Transcript_37651:4015-4818(-)